MPKSIQIVCRFCDKIFDRVKVAQVACKNCDYLEFVDKSLVPRHKYY